MLNRLKDVFKSFQQHEVRYVVIGGIAVVLYGVPRATFDLGILIEATPENAQRLLDALIDVRMGTATLTNVDEILALAFFVCLRLIYGLVGPTTVRFSQWVPYKKERLGAVWEDVKTLLTLHMGYELFTNQ